MYSLNEKISMVNEFFVPIQDLKKILSEDRNSMQMSIFCVYNLEQINLNGQFVYLCIFVICLWQVFGGSCDEFGHLKPCNPGSHEGSFNWTYPETEDLHNRPPQRQDNAVLAHVTNGF